MLDTRKKLMIYIGALLAFLIIIFLVYWYFFSQGNNDISMPNGSNPNQIESAIDYEPDPIFTQEAIDEAMARQAVVDPEELYAKQVAKNFVERFATFSNQNDNVHIKDALTMATEKMGVWIKSQTLDKSNDYQGQTVRVIASNIAEISPDTAIVNVEAQKFINGGGETKVENISGQVNLEKVGSDWKVAGLFWD